MNDFNQQITPLEWEVSIFKLKTKEQEKSLPALIILLFIILLISFKTSAFFFFLLISLFFNYKSKLRESENKNIEKYKIDNKGIRINKVQKQKITFYLWKDMELYYYDTNIIHIKTKTNQYITLKTLESNKAKVLFLLSKKLKKQKFGESFSLQTQFFQKNQKKIINTGFTTSIQEKENHKQTIVNRRKEEEEQKIKNQKIRITAFFTLMIFATLFYFISQKNDFLSEYNTMLKKRNLQLIPPNQNSNNYQERQGWPRDKKEIVQCSVNSDCELYFYFQNIVKTSFVNEIDFNRYVVTAMDTQNNCVWGVVNKKYKKLWWNRYPLPKSCDTSIIKEKKTICNRQTNTCDFY